MTNSNAKIPKRHKARSYYLLQKHVGMLTEITHRSPANYGIAECIERVINCHLLPWHRPLKHVCV